ncbi:YegS/Rv2252/BmrU family lipid kinase [Alcanivorax sp.]|uniref:diacylglycerol/lipid kinase family protein n=1 Tax=Alcanivorax sp. TaxID=1872427 RepID=UPI0025C154CB|nr:YegS/Rv2252/BmrU family lipid kinase [Alcanivorax sp.]
MKVTVIYNPTAGGGREALLCRFVAELERQGASVRLYYTKGPNDATDYLSGLADQGDCVVAVGGDGTTNEVLNGLAAGVALGVFATGTANVLAKELGLPKKPEQAAQVVVKGKSVSVTPARLNGRRFIMMCGIGYDAWVVNGVNLGIKDRFGKLAYVLSMLGQVGRYGQRHYRVEVDGRPLDCFSAIITNGRHYGGSFVLSNEANILRPQVQVLLFQKPGVRFLLRCLVALLFGRMERMDGVASLRAQRVHIRCENGDEPIQADGDPAGSLPAEIEVEDAPVPMRVAVLFDS